MKAFLAAVLVGSSFTVQAESFWHVTELRRLVAYECVDAPDPGPKIEEVACPEDTAEGVKCFAEVPVIGEPELDCDWVDSMDKEQVQYADGTMFILINTETNYPEEMIFFADVEAGGEVFTYEYAFALDQEAADVRQMATSSAETPTVFFFQYTPDTNQYKFNLDLGDGYLSQWNFWPEGGIE